MPSPPDVLFTVPVMFFPPTSVVVPSPAAPKATLPVSVSLRSSVPAPVKVVVVIAEAAFISASPVDVTLRSVAVTAPSN